MTDDPTDGVHVLVPFDADSPKTRLDDVLSERERRTLAARMLEDVLAALGRLAVDCTVLATAPLEGPDGDRPDPAVPVVVDDRPLTRAVNARLAGDLVGTAEPPVPSRERPVAIVMADLPLATAGALRRLLTHEGRGGPAPDVTMAPGRAGGTNALCVRDPSFRVDYHGASCRDHRDLARRRGLDLAAVDSFRLATDVDERADLVEVLLHGQGTGTRRWLRAEGFSLVTGDGRVRAGRGGRGTRSEE